MKFISNIILVVFCSLFLGSGYLYSNSINQDINDNGISYKQQIVVDKVISWMRIHNRYPLQGDYGKKPYQLGVNRNDVKAAFGSVDAIDVLKEKVLDSDTEGEFTRLILSSPLLTRYWILDKTRREKLQRRCIEKIFSWIDSLDELDKRWPSAQEIKEITGILINTSRVFDDNKQLIIEAIKLDKDQKYLRYMIQQTILWSEVYSNDEVKEILQTWFIRKYLIPWVLKNRRWLTSRDYGKESYKVGLSERKVLGSSGLFSDDEELKNKVLTIVDKNTKQIILDILNSNEPVDINEESRVDNEELTVEQEQIIETIIYWIRRNGRYPKDKEFGVGVGRVGITVKEVKDVFESNRGTEVVKEKIFDMDTKGEFTKVIVQSKLPIEHWYRNQKRRQLLQKRCIDKIFEWFDSLDEKDKRFPTRQDIEDLFGVSIRKLFIKDEPTIFDSYTDVAKKIVLYDTDQKLFRYIIINSYWDYDFYHDEEIRKKLQRYCIDQIFQWIDSLDEDKKIFPSLEKLQQIFGFRTININHGLYYSSSENIESTYFYSYTDLLIKALEQDKDQKYFPYILEKARYGRGILDKKTEFYSEEIRSKVQRYCIEKIFRWIDSLDESDKRWPIIDELPEILGMDPNFIFSNFRNVHERKTRIFVNGYHLKIEAMKLDIEDKYLGYIFETRLNEKLNEGLEPLQNYFILQYFLPWVYTHKRWIQGEDFGVEEGKIGFSAHKMIKLFGSMYQLRLKVLDIIEDYDESEKDKIYQYILDWLNNTSNLNFEEVFRNVEDNDVRKKLQNFFLRKHVHVFVMKNNGNFPELVDTNYNYTKKYLGYYISLMFDSVDAQGNVIKKGLFNSIEDLEDQYRKTFLPNNGRCNGLFLNNKSK